MALRSVARQPARAEPYEGPRMAPVTALGHLGARNQPNPFGLMFFLGKAMPIRTTLNAHFFGLGRFSATQHQLTWLPNMQEPLVGRSPVVACTAG